MSFWRGEALDGVKRWREAGVAAAVLGLGLYWALTGLGFIAILGWVLALIGLGLGWAAVQRARFQAGHGGLGVVEVDERQIAYLAPVGGGLVSIEALDEISIGPDLAGLAVWRLRGGAGMLSIPASAEGTAQLFDVLTSLPGADLEAAIRASRARRQSGATVIWRRPAR